MAVRIAARTDVMSATNGLPGTVRTIAFWMKSITSHTDYSPAMDLPATTANSAPTWSYIGTKNASPNLVYAQSPSFESTAYVASANTWYKVCAVCNGTSLTWYRAPDGSVLTTYSDTIGSLTPAKLWIGGSSWPAEWLDGAICDFKLWNVALTLAEVNAEFASSYVAVKTSGLLRHHRLIVGETTDYSGNGNVLTLGTTTPVYTAGPASLTEPSAGPALVIPPRRRGANFRR